jgi:hypothetical protein
MIYFIIYFLSCPSASFFAPHTALSPQGDELSPRGSWGICVPVLPEGLTLHIQSKSKFHVSPSYHVRLFGNAGIEPLTHVHYKSPPPPNVYPPNANPHTVLTYDRTKENFLVVGS